MRVASPRPLVFSVFLISLMGTIALLGDARAAGAQSTIGKRAPLSDSLFLLRGSPENQIFLSIGLMGFRLKPQQDCTAAPVRASCAVVQEPVTLFHRSAQRGLDKAAERLPKGVGRILKSIRKGYPIFIVRV